MPRKGLPHEAGLAAGIADQRSQSLSSADDKSTDLERKFDFYFRALAPDYPEPEHFYHFGRYELDRAWPCLKVSVELHGGAGGGYGRPVVCHQCGVRVKARKADGSIGRELRLPYVSHSGKGAERDAAKGNALQLAGWVALEFTSAQLDSDPVAVIEQVVSAIKAASQGHPPKQHIPTEALGLSPRELEVIGLLCEGLSYAEIAACLFIQVDTVTKHIVNIKAKTGAKTLPQVTSMATRAGILAQHSGSVRVSDHLAVAAAD